MAQESGHSAGYVFWEMPCPMVFAFEHVYYARNDVAVARAGKQVADGLESVLNLL